MSNRPLICNAPQALSLQKCGEVWVPMAKQPDAERERVVRQCRQAMRLGVLYHDPGMAIKPPFAPGDTLLVREPWGLAGARLVDPCLNYRADGAQVPVHRRNTPIPDERGDLPATDFSAIHWEGPGGLTISPELLRIPEGWRPARTMPDWAVRTRRMVLAVEPRLLASISSTEEHDCGLGDFEAFWRKRYPRHPWTGWAWRVGLVAA